MTYEDKKYLVDLLGGKCRICGYSYIGGLQFHHLDRTTKKFNIGKKKRRSKNTILSEITKCIVVCANCHKEIEDGIITLDFDCGAGI